MLAHGEEYLTVFNDAPPEDARIAELMKLSRRHGVTVTANVQGIATIAAQWGKPEAVAQYLQRPEALRMRPELRKKWERAAYQRLDGQYAAEAAFVQRLTTALHDARVPILVGTDTPDIQGVPPGASVIDEIEALHRLGFPRFDALAAATREPGRFVRRTLSRRTTLRPGATRPPRRPWSCCRPTRWTSRPPCARPRA